eukprot:Opistho-1_new@73241
MKLNLLIVDDDKMVQTLHSIIAKKSGLTDSPINFADGQQAFDYIIKNNGDDAYLILLDINMPVMNGWELLEALKKQALKNQIFVVMVSSSIDQHDLDKASTYPMYSALI